MKKLTGLAALTLALCLATLGAFAQNGHANEAIRIGLMGPMTGSWASEVYGGAKKSVGNHSSSN